MGKKYNQSDSPVGEKDFFNWKQIENNDPIGLEEIYERYSSELFSLGMSIIQDQELVTDCIQEVFLNLWNYRLTIKKIDNLKLYLFKCLRNRIYKEIKEEKRKIQFNTQQVSEPLLLVDTLENELIKDQVDQEKAARLLLAMKTLSPRQREVIRHFFFDNQSYEEIAEMMGINVQSVYTLAWKAISRLKKSMLGSILLFVATH